MTPSMLLLLLLPYLLFSFTIQIKYPEINLNSGSELFLRGNHLGLSWNEGIIMKKVASDTWEREFRSSSPVDLEFKVLVNDTTWQRGANLKIHAVADDSRVIQVFPWFFSGQGRVTVLPLLKSPQLGNERHIRIYFPPSYFENTFKEYDAMMMHDAQNLFFDKNAAFGVAWHVQDAIDQNVGQGIMRELAIIGIDNTPDRMNELTYDFDPSVGAGGKGDLYLDFLEQTVLPTVQKSFPRIGHHVKGIGGSSLGGLISCYAAWTRPETYSYGMCMSSSFWWNSQSFNNTILTKYPVPIPSLNTLYLESGDQGPSQDDKQQTLTVLASIKRLGFEKHSHLEYHLLQGGSHNEASWGKVFPLVVSEMFPPLWSD